MKLDNVETISPLQKFANQPYYFGASEPSSSDRVDGFTWFEPGASLPQPWTWNDANQCWLSSTMIMDWGYVIHSLAQFGVGWTYKTMPFYGVVNNRIYFKHLFGTMWNVGSVAHDSTNLFYAYSLHRFLGSAQLQVTLNLDDYSSGLTVPTYSVSNGIDNRPSSSSMKRITQMNVNTWMEGNTWWQRLYYARYGSSTGSGGSIGISLQQCIQYARI